MVKVNKAIEGEQEEEHLGALMELLFCIMQQTMQDERGNAAKH